MNKKILVVDDEGDFLEMIKINLERAGDYEVFTSPRARDILTMVREIKPDLILLDILMPGTGGIEACEMLNSDPAGKKVPIIILSALEKESDKLKAYKVGVVDYLIKPIERDDLVAKIEKALRFRAG